MAKRSKTAVKSKTVTSTNKPRTSLEALVNQKLRDNFNNFGPDETDVIKDPLTGQTLRERLREECRDWLAGKPVIWGFYTYENLKIVYRRRTAVYQELKPSDPTLLACQQLVQAVMFKTVS